MSDKSVLQTSCKFNAKKVSKKIKFDSENQNLFFSDAIGPFASATGHSDRGFVISIRMEIFLSLLTR